MSGAKDDRLALVAILIGAGLALVGWRTPIELSSGIAIALGGVLLALRGKRPIAGRAWLRAALFCGALAIVVSMALGVYAEWVAGQWFAEGSQPGDTSQELRRIAHTAMLARYGGLFGACAFLLGAIANRFSGNEKDERQDERHK